MTRYPLVFYNLLLCLSLKRLSQTSFLSDEIHFAYIDLGEDVD